MRWGTDHLVNCITWITLPDHPGALSPGLHSIEPNLVLEGVHGLPESVPTKCCKFAFGHQTLKRFLHQFLALMDVFEYFGPHNEKSSIDPKLLVSHGADISH